MNSRLLAKDVVDKIPKQVFWNEIQRNILTSYAFSKLRCGGEKDLTPEEKTFLDGAFEKYFSDYDVEKEGRLPLAYALTQRETNRY